MSNVGSELRNIVEVANLPWGVLLWLGHESIGKGLVVSENVKGTAFQEVSELSDGQIDHKELPVKGTVPRRGWFQLLRAVSDGIPFSSDPVLLSLSHVVGHQYKYC